MNEALESMLVELRQIVSPPRVRTLFGVGGRGYYENPASDLLAFFMRPDEVHELESLFLEAFLECAGKKADGYAMEGVMVEREVDVPAGGRIDLLVRGPGWVLVIENKVYHHQANPFKNYQDYAAELLKGIAPVLVVLSPDGQTDQKGWVGVSYQSYCQSLRRRLDSLELALSTSKWVLFAREWILHLELELYTSPMTTEQIAFADQHLKELEQAKRLHADYRAFLMDRLPRLLGRLCPGRPSMPATMDGQFAVPGSPGGVRIWRFGMRTGPMKSCTRSRCIWSSPQRHNVRLHRRNCEIARK